LSIADHDSGPPNLDINQSLNGILFKGVLGTREPWNPPMLNQAHHLLTKFWSYPIRNSNILLGSHGMQIPATFVTSHYEFVCRWWPGNQGLTSLSLSSAFASALINT
jgi:hypothetical protein